MMRRATLLCSIAATLVATTAAAAPALPLNPRAYALVVGSNPGGAGQETLRFAESDAGHMRQVLTEIGAYAPGNVKLLLRPTVADVSAALDALKTRIDADHAEGQDATLFFYYSGHARANAMNLGDGTLELSDLRSRLTALPTALTIVVLDACQSGAFERVKGASATQDFSYNSVSSLSTRGLAVMASSSSAELSQESEHLGSSYFTHYLLVALRGAGDQNEDGRVSLDEAYRYAYAETLAATSRTRVGEQHVTLETELTGRGDVAVTYPSAETSQLVLPPAFDGQVLVQTRAHHAVMAELTKAPGAPLRLALPPATYDAVVRRSGNRWACGLELRDNQAATLDLTKCSPIAEEPALAKGDVAMAPTGDLSAAGPPPREDRAAERETWSIEAALGGGPLHDDGYVSQLREFGYERTPDSPFPLPLRVDWSLGAARRIFGPVFVLARARQLDERDFERNVPGSTRSFGWTTYGFSLGARATWEPTEAAGIYGQLEVGTGLAVSELRDQTSTPTIDETETYWGFLGTAAAGLQMNAWRHGGIFLEWSYAYAPVVSNLIGDTHDSGGFRFLVGIRARVWGKP